MGFVFLYNACVNYSSFVLEIHPKFDCSICMSQYEWCNPGWQCNLFGNNWT